MPNPTLTKGGTPNFNSSGTTTLQIYHAREHVGKASNQTNQPLPKTDSDKTLLIDLLGATCTIDYTGTIQTDDLAELWKYARDIKSLITGSQGNTGGSQVGYILTPRGTNDYKTTPPGADETVRVYVIDADYDWEPGNPNQLSYKISLMQAAGNSK